MKHKQEPVFFFYLILLPQHGELVVVNGWFHSLDIQVFNAEIEIPKPEHKTEQKANNLWESNTLKLKQYKLSLVMEAGSKNIQVHWGNLE